MARYGFVIDITKCNGCYNCFLACRDEHCGNDFPCYAAPQPMNGHFWMKMIADGQSERFATMAALQQQIDLGQADLRDAVDRLDNASLSFVCQRLLARLLSHSSAPPLLIRH